MAPSGALLPVLTASSFTPSSNTEDDNNFPIIALSTVFGIFLAICIAFCICSYKRSRRYRNLPQQQRRRNNIPRQRQETPRPSPTLRPLDGWTQPSVLSNPWIAARLAQRQANRDREQRSDERNAGHGHVYGDSTDSADHYASNPNPNASTNNDDAWKNDKPLPPYSPRSPRREEWLSATSNYMNSPVSPAAVVVASPRIVADNHRDVESGLPLLSGNSRTASLEVRWGV